jgi:hypothetical protein
MASCSTGSDTKGKADALVWQIGSVTEVKNGPLTLGQPVDGMPNRVNVDTLGRVAVATASIRRNGQSTAYAFNQASDPPCQAVVVDAQPVQRPEGPCVGIGNLRTCIQLTPETEHRLLDGVGSRLVIETQASDEAEHLLRSALVERMHRPFTGILADPERGRGRARQ